MARTPCTNTVRLPWLSSGQQWRMFTGLQTFSCQTCVKPCWHEHHPSTVIFSIELPLKGLTFHTAKIVSARHSCLCRSSIGFSSPVSLGDGRLHAGLFVYWAVHRRYDSNGQLVLHWVASQEGAPSSQSVHLCHSRIFKQPTGSTGLPGGFKRAHHARGQ